MVVPGFPFHCHIRFYPYQVFKVQKYTRTRFFFPLSYKVLSVPGFKKAGSQVTFSGSQVLLFGSQFTLSDAQVIFSGSLFALVGSQSVFAGVQYILSGSLCFVWITAG